MPYIAKEKILIIDDDHGVVKTICSYLKRMEIEFNCAATLKQGLDKIDQSDFDIVLLDVNLPDGNGIERIPNILNRTIPPLVIIMTAYSDPDGAEMAIETGAWDYLQKPVSLKDLRLQVRRALEFQEQKKQAAIQIKFDAADIIGNSTAIQSCLTQASQIIYSDANVLITGETGTGKELFAKAIHDNSARRNGEFIVVDCSLLSESLIESVLFGHEKGAFTGADKNRKGLVDLANGGTLFLDEVGELPASIQSSFLRVLQEKSFRPIGSEKEIYSDFRVICATNKDIQQMAAKNCFRTDLLYRLKTFVIDLPPLRDRKEDILQISKYQTEKSCKEHNIPVKKFSSDFVETLVKYDWPGNVRELINTVETSVTSAHFENILFAFHLPSNIRAKIVRSTVDKLCHTGDLDTDAHFVSATSLSHKQFMDKQEKQYLRLLYESTRRDIQVLMEKTALSRTVLYRKLKKYNIQ